MPISVRPDLARPETPESSVIGQLGKTIINEEQFHEFRERNGFTDGFHGTFKQKEKHLYLYTYKPDHEVDTQQQAQNSLTVIRYLTEKGILYPHTQWGAYQTKDGKYQLFAVTRKLERYDAQLNGRDGRSLVKDIGNSYQGLLDEDSHVLEWVRRIDLNFDPKKEKSPENELIDLLNIWEASHSSNWAWDEKGRLFPIDVEVVRVVGEKRQQVIKRWLEKNK